MTVQIIVARNVNDALFCGLKLLDRTGVVNQSRNGPALVAPGPVITEYTNPDERVMFSALRDANPFFHLYECIWMMAGRRDAVGVARYAKTMETFAGADGTLAGSYGHRWREFFGFDQIQHIAAMLQADPKTRRAVMAMWDASHDLEDGASSLDIPCNTHVYFDASAGVLNMTVCNRSNDIVWGAYGANSVHMSFLQEVVAAAVGLPMGKYYQISNNYHLYLDRPDVQRLLSFDQGSLRIAYVPDDRYAPWESSPTGITEFVKDFNLAVFLDQCVQVAEDPCNVATGNYFLDNVVTPMMRGHREYKYGDYEGALYAIKLCKSADWRTAGVEWVQRRVEAHKTAVLKGVL